MRDAVGECRGEQGGGVAGGIGAGAEAAAKLCGSLADAGQCAAVGIGGAMGDGGEAHADLGVGSVAQRVAFFEQGGEVGGQGFLARRACGHHHGGEPWMGAEGRHASSEVGDPSRLVQRTEGAQECLAGSERAGGWLIGEWQIGRRRAPCGAVEREA